MHNTLIPPRKTNMTMKITKIQTITLLCQPKKSITKMKSNTLAIY